MTMKVFHSKHCPYCEEAIKKLKKKNCDFELIDVDENPEIADKYDVWSLPTSILEDGTKIHSLLAVEKCKCKSKKSRRN